MKAISKLAGAALLIIIPLWAFAQHIQQNPLAAERLQQFQAQNSQSTIAERLDRTGMDSAHQIASVPQADFVRPRAPANANQ